MYADYEYYISEYLLGRSPAVPESEFLFWEKQARTEIDRFTFGRVAADQTLVTERYLAHTGLLYAGV